MSFSQWLENNDYQEEHCHYFAEKLRAKLRETLKLKVNFCLLEGFRSREENDPEEVLIHVWVAVHGNKIWLVDSKGICDENETHIRGQEWKNWEKYYGDPSADFSVEFVEAIPSKYYNKGCDSKTLQVDIDNIIGTLDIKQFA